MPENTYSTAKADSFDISNNNKVELIGLRTGTVNPVSTRNQGKAPTSGLFVQVPLEVLEGDVSPSALKLYMVLLKYARQSRECWPGHQTLARDMSLKPRRIASLLKELDQAGLVTIISWACQGQSNLYQLHKVVGKEVDAAATFTGKTEAAYPPAENCYPGKQKIAGEGMQYIATEAYASEIHSSINNNNHNNMQSSELEKSQDGFNGHGNIGQDQICVNVVSIENKNEEKGLIGATPASTSSTTFHNQPSNSL